MIMQKVKRLFLRSNFRDKEVAFLHMLLQSWKRSCHIWTIRVGCILLIDQPNNWNGLIFQKRETSLKVLITTSCGWLIHPQYYFGSAMKKNMQDLPLIFLIHT